MNDNNVAVKPVGADPLLPYIFRLLAEGHLAFPLDNERVKDKPGPPVFYEGAD